MTKIYTIIVTYNAMRWIEKCLSCLDESTIHSRIVVVDNCSTDETLNFIEKNHPHVHIIKNEKNRGFGQANNQGIEYAYREGATHFFLCNQDLYVKADTLQKLIDVQNKEGLYVTSPLQMNGSFTLIDQSFYNVFAKNNNEFVSDLVNGALANYYKALYIPAAAWVLSRECIEQIGGFDPIFFHYSEDANYLHRVNYHKKKIGVVPLSLVAHDRVFKGNITAFNKYAPLSTLISLHANPSYNVFSIKKERMVKHLIFLREILKSLFSLNLKHSIELLSSYMTFWCRIRKISYSIRENRKIGSNWLNINSKIIK